MTHKKGHKEYQFINIRLPVEKHEAVREIAHKLKISMNNLMIMSVDKVIKKYKDLVIFFERMNVFQKTAALPFPTTSYV